MVLLVISGLQMRRRHNMNKTYVIKYLCIVCLSLFIRESYNVLSLFFLYVISHITPPSFRMPVIVSICPVLDYQQAGVRTVAAHFLQHRNFDVQRMRLNTYDCCFRQHIFFKFGLSILSGHVLRKERNKPLTNH